MHKEVKVEVLSGRSDKTRPPYSLLWELEEGVACSEVVRDLVDTLQLQQKEAWHLVERWNGCERVIASDEDVFLLNEEWAGESDDCVRFRLRAKRKSVPGITHYKKRGKSARKMKLAILTSPKSFLSKKITHKRLCCAKWMLNKALRKSQKKYSNLLLQRLVKREPLWGPREPTPLDLLQATLAEQKAHNLELSTEISDLNILSTRLRNQVNPLRQREQPLANELARLQEEVAIKREEKERRGPKDLAQVQTEILKLKRELETRNRLNTSYTTKLKIQKEMFAEKRKILKGKQALLSALLQTERSPDQHSHIGSDETDMSQEKQLSDTFTLTSTNEQNDKVEVHTPTHSRKEHKVSSTSMKRHSSKFEAKTKQLVEEEGVTFRKVQSRLRDGQLTPDQTPSKRRIRATNISPAKRLNLDPDEAKELFRSTDLSTYKKSAIHLHTEGPDVLVIPQEDTDWYQNSQDATESTSSSADEPISQSTKVKGDTENSEGLTTDDLLSTLDLIYKRNDSIRSSFRRETVPKVGRRVRFTPDCLILNAALDGDLDLLQQCVKELGSCSQTSDKGATCLHNAACSGSMPTVEYLVEMACDINVQDTDGWTPLHCATAYSNIEMISYLLDNGSSMFLATLDGDTPLKIAVEEYEVQKSSLDKEGPVDKNEEDGLEQSQQKSCEAAGECLHYLMDMQTNLGVYNNGNVFGLFARKATDSEELSFGEGEPLVIIDRGGRRDQWWLAENAHGQRGQVPCTFLGSNCRHSVVL